MATDIEQAPYLVDVGVTVAEPKLLGSWLAIQQAEIMLIHVRDSGAAWPEVAIYLHSCITAMRSVTLTMKKALAHEPGFDEWYEREQAKLAADDEFVYLREARNQILHTRGALNLKHAFEFKYTGGLQIEMRGIGPDGPDIWVTSGDETIPADWRKLDGLEFNVPLKFGPIDDLPAAPEGEVKELLREKISVMRMLLFDAEERFDPASFDAEEAAKQRLAITGGEGLSEPPDQSARSERPPSNTEQQPPQTPGS